MKDPVVRTIAAKAALYFWVAQGSEQIVLADATETNLLTEDEAAEVDKSRTRVEQINYKQASEDVIRKGKGYGEGKLIKPTTVPTSLVSIIFTKHSIVI
jgi:hypothetical protein